MKKLWPLALAVALPAACGSDERFEPRVVAGVPDASPGVPPPVLPEAAPPPTPKRSVTWKNPFGNVAAKHNLLWDGDFEWSTAFAQQAGWVNAGTLVSFSAFSQVRPDPACKSGIKCAYLTQHQRVAAIGVAPGAGQNVQASLWVKVPGTHCSVVGAALISCDYQADPDVELTDADGVPDAGGWCELRVIAAPRTRATCLYVESRFEEGEALIDDAVVRAAPAGAAPTGGSAAMSERTGEARRRIREALRPGPREPAAAAVAFEHWSRRAR